MHDDPAELAGAAIDLLLTNATPGSPRRFLSDATRPRWVRGGSRRPRTGHTGGPATTAAGRSSVGFRHRPGPRGPHMSRAGIGASMGLFDRLGSPPLIRFDVPGAGASPPPRMPYSPHRPALEARALAPRLGYPR